ncbi:hypothetical protein ACTWJ8_02815 [Streptomyces sp. SDT5-1]|uniref:hypothetical protein n=1 Tax=Streptomyces sp. SDT5-1 TaxID=3406418 RepID=UPI003FD3A4A2
MCFELEVEDATQGVNLRVECTRLAMTLQIMDALGMIEHLSPPREPLPEDHGTTAARVTAFLSTDSEETPPDLEQFAGAVGALFDGQAEDPVGIPCYKFSHGGWLLTPDEIAAALGWWTLATPQIQAYAREGLPWWSQWLDLLITARDHGGIRVW